jgi:hypothetical protein
MAAKFSPAQRYRFGCPNTLMVIDRLREEDVRKSWEKCGRSVEGIR